MYMGNVYASARGRSTHTSQRKFLRFHGNPVESERAAKNRSKRNLNTRIKLYMPANMFCPSVQTIADGGKKEKSRFVHHNTIMISYRVQPYRYTTS